MISLAEMSFNELPKVDLVDAMARRHIALPEDRYFQLPLDPVDLSPDLFSPVVDKIQGELLKGTYQTHDKSYKPVHLYSSSDFLTLDPLDIHIDVSGICVRVLVDGPDFTPADREILVTLCRTSAYLNRTLDMSIEVTRDCGINEGRRIMTEILEIVKNRAGRVDLNIPDRLIPLFPRIPIEKINSSFVMPELKSFSWRGDIKYLPGPWRSISELPFEQLTDLALHCDISIEDCTEILYRGRNIVNFELNAYKHRRSIMKHSFRDDRRTIIKRSKLETFSISYPGSCRSLFEKLHFLSMRHVSLKMDTAAVAWLPNIASKWVNASSVTLLGRLDRRISADIRSQFNHEVMHHHETLNGVVLTV